MGKSIPTRPIVITSNAHFSPNYPTKTVVIMASTFSNRRNLLPAETYHARQSKASQPTASMDSLSSGCTFRWFTCNTEFTASPKKDFLIHSGNDYRINTLKVQVWNSRIPFQQLCRITTPIVVDWVQAELSKS